MTWTDDICNAWPLSLMWLSAFWRSVLPNNNRRVIVRSILPGHPWPLAALPPSTAPALWSTTCTGSDLPQLVLHSAFYGRKRMLRCLHSEWGCWSNGTVCVWKGQRRHTSDGGSKDGDGSEMWLRCGFHLHFLHL